MTELASGARPRIDDVIRGLKIQELTARLNLSELERKCLSGEFASPTSDEHRVAMHLRAIELRNEWRDAKRDLKGLRRKFVSVE
jgi:hypothetical protein